MPAPQRADETLKAFHLFIHDLRAPLGVAQGYLRLLQQNKLEAEAERERALAQTMEALGRIGRLCEDANAFIAEPASTAGPVSTLQVADLVEQVQAACAVRCPGLSVGAAGNALSGVVSAAHLDRVVQSLAVIFCAVRRATRNQSVRVSVLEEGKEARFLLGCDEDRTALLSRSAEEFDPWRGGHGIALPLACRTVTDAGGRIWTFADGRGAIGIAFPEEASAQ
jgi:light-regulated signal transduction histidine kinase (bacteriophytochrome)